MKFFTPLEIMPRSSAAGLDFRMIPAGFNPLRQRLRGECPAEISNGVYSNGWHALSLLYTICLYCGSLK